VFIQLTGLSDVEFNHRTLPGQIYHKLAFIRDHIPPPPRTHPHLQLILIGHSIGCYMILSLLRSRVRVHRAALLFPTVERMAESPSGRVITPLLKYGARWLLPLVSYPIHYLVPDVVKRFIINKVCSLIYLPTLTHAIYYNPITPGKDINYN